MKKKKIKKLEISREDITILSKDDAKAIAGGVMSDYYIQTNCGDILTIVGFECMGYDPTYPCTSTIADTQLCNLSSGGGCYTDWYGPSCRS